MFPALVIPLYIMWCYWSEDFWLPGTSDYIFFFKNYIYKFLKKLKLNLNIVNDVIYKHAKLQSKILYIVGYTKITSDKKWRFENMHSHIYMFVIFV
jgi:hypothetical protein